MRLDRQITNQPPDLPGGLIANPASCANVGFRARLRHVGGRLACLLTRKDLKLAARRQSDAFDPERKWHRAQALGVRLFNLKYLRRRGSLTIKCAGAIADYSQIFFRV
jgi:hypothetical protein